MLNADIRIMVVYFAALNIVWACRRENGGCVQPEDKRKLQDKNNNNYNDYNNNNNNDAFGKGSASASKGGKGKKGTDATEKPRKRCCPYNFDSSRCRIVDDRVLCGYDSNIGGPVAEKERIKELSAGCHLRGKRIECGYRRGPYTNPRRPLAHIVQPDDYDDKDKKNNATENSKMKWGDQWNLRKDMNCVEIRGRIVCPYK